ncbi:protein PET117 homolog, mitochondrial-like [Tubulanus polymorphus]|uniref:protein PET117 homolog, mitochondrial-like n=1 Tax=Tubulanus polymorphus TaxID=672921 RepID=UPI003DA640A0
MSLASKVTLGGSIIVSTGIIVYVHFKQKTERERLREGVYRDVERQAMKKTQNLKNLQDQIEWTKILVAERDNKQKQDS